MSTTAKPYKGIGMNGAIARWYGKNASRSISEYRRDAERVVQRLGPGSHVLEIAPGPGYQAIELAKLGAYRVLGIDVQFLLGNASDLRLGANHFDLVYCRAVDHDDGGELGQARASPGTARGDGGGEPVRALRDTRVVDWL